MEFERIWNNLDRTKITKYYLLTIFSVTCCISYIKPINTFYHLCLSHELIIQNFQVKIYFFYFILLKLTFEDLEIIY
jgi:hypothetical protein